MLYRTEPDAYRRNLGRVMPPPVLAVLTAWEPSHPRLTWYGEAGERVELSGRVLTNWAVKAANLLVSECDAGPGTRVHLDLPAHWRLLVWSLGAWATGAEVTSGEVPDAGAHDVVVSDRPDRWPSSASEVVAVPLPALAMAWPGRLPAGAIDGAADLMSQPDEPLFATGNAPRRGADAGARTLLLAEEPSPLIAQAWACWERGGSVVVVTPRPEREVATIRDQEGVDAQGTVT